MAKADSPRRELVRVDDRIEVSHRMVTKAEFDALGQTIIHRSARQSSLESIDELIADALKALNSISKAVKP